jgi:hypothetical protein
MTPMIRHETAANHEAIRPSGTFIAEKRASLEVGEP